MSGRGTQSCTASTAAYNTTAYTSSRSPQLPRGAPDATITSRLRRIESIGGQDGGSLPPPDPLSGSSAAGKVDARGLSQFSFRNERGMNPVLTAMRSSSRVASCGSKEGTRTAGARVNTRSISAALKPAAIAKEVVAANDHDCIGAKPCKTQSADLSGYSSQQSTHTNVKPLKQPAALSALKVSDGTNQCKEDVRTMLMLVLPDLINYNLENFKIRWHQS